MTALSLSLYRARMLALSAAYRDPLEEPTIMAWYQLLSDIPDELFAQAVDRLLMTLPGTGVPNPRLIREVICDLTGILTSTQAWQRFLRQCAGSAKRAYAEADRATKAGVDACGGYVTLGTSNETQYPWFFRAFKEAYDAERLALLVEYLHPARPLLDQPGVSLDGACVRLLGRVLPVEGE